MGVVLKFGRPVKTGDVIRCAGLGYYVISRVDGYSLHGYRSMSPEGRLTFGSEHWICEDYRKVFVAPNDPGKTRIHVVHADGVPIL